MYNRSMRMTKEQFIKNFHLKEKDIEYLYTLNEQSKQFRNKSKHKDVLLFEIKMKVNKYKEVFYVNAIQVGMKTVDLILYNTYEEAYREIDSIIEETIQGSLF